MSPFEINNNGLFLDFLKREIVAISWAFTKKEPSKAVDIIIERVYGIPIKSLILKKTTISITGNTKNNKNHFI